MKVDKAVCTNDTLEDLTRAIKYEAVFTNLVEKKILAIKRECEEKKKAKKNKRRSFGRILFGKRIFGFGGARKSSTATENDANTEKRANGKGDVKKHIEVALPKIDDKVKTIVKSKTFGKSLRVQHKRTEDEPSTSIDVEPISLDLKQQSASHVDSQAEDSNGSNGNGSLPEIGGSRDLVVEVITHRDGHSYDDSEGCDRNDDKDSIVLNTIEKPTDISSLGSIRIDENASTIADGSLTSVKDSSESLSFPSSRCTISAALATTVSYERERSRLRVLEAKSISAQCSPILPRQKKPPINHTAQTQTHNKLLSQVSYTNDFRGHDAPRYFSRQNTSEDSANLTISTLLNEPASSITCIPVERKSKSASVLVVTDKEHKKAIHRLDSNIVVSYQSNPLMRELISSYNQFTTSSNCLPVITTTVSATATTNLPITKSTPPTPPLPQLSKSTSNSAAKIPTTKATCDTIKLQRMTSTSTGSSVGPIGCCATKSSAKEKEKKPKQRNWEAGQSGGSDDEYRKRKRKYKRYHRCSDPVLVYPTSGGLQHCILSMPPNQPIQFHYNDDFVYDMTLQVEADKNGDLQAIVPSHRSHRHRHHRHKKRHRHKKPKILVHDLDTQSVKVIDPDDLPQRARWTIIATACLLLIMCLMLVGITLRMAPIIDDMESRTLCNPLPKKPRKFFHNDGEVFLPIDNETGSTTNEERNFYASRFTKDKKIYTNLSTVSYNDISEYEELSRDATYSRSSFQTSHISPLNVIKNDKNFDFYNMADCTDEMTPYFNSPRFDRTSKSSSPSQIRKWSTSPSTFRPSSSASSIGCSSHSSPSAEIKNKKKCSQRNRNLGRAYISATGKQVPKRKIIPLQPCRKKCKEKFQSGQMEMIHKNYWKLGSYDLRVAFVFSCIKRIETKSCFKRKSSRTRYNDRLYSYLYFFELDGKEINVCQLCFKKIINETNSFIYNVIDKKYKRDVNILELDQRGRHPPPNKTDSSQIEGVKKHILSFPSYESHYSRKHTNRRYLPSNLNVQEMYNLYKTEVILPVSINIYRRIFNEIGLKFKRPSNDTCSTCDSLQIKLSVSSGQQHTDLLTQQQVHQKEADDAYNSKKIDKENCESNTAVFSFDLQQVLPTPYLSTNRAYYKRQLSTYNLTIHNCKTNESTHCMWYESVAARGANEIASCLYRFLMECVGPEITKIILYSDTCGGQNKNSYVSAMFVYLVRHHPTIKLIDHKFLIPGHTHMECDIDHAVIERKLKTRPFPINLPSDWYQLVLVAGKKQKFNVLIMNEDNFFSFKKLICTSLNWSKNNTVNEKFIWRPIKWLRYENNGFIQYKNSIDAGLLFKEIKIEKTTRRSTSEWHLEKLNHGPVPISDQKKKDLIALFEFCDVQVHDFYKKLKTVSGPARDTDPDIDRLESDVEI